MASRELMSDQHEFGVPMWLVPEPVTVEQPVVAPVVVPPAPSVGSAFGQLVSAIRDVFRDLRPALDRKTALRLIGQGISVVGVLLLCLALFEGFIGNLTERRDQRELRGAFEKMLESQGGYAMYTQGGTTIIPPGTPVAALDIPKIGLRKIVAEGTTSDDLRKGPGHLRSTPLPGQHGNAVIAGRRTTYAGPFRKLNDLIAGDEINVTTPFGEFTYEVRDVSILNSGDPDGLGATMTDNLTLTTSDPPFRANKRLVVSARLEGKPSTFPDPLRQTKVPIGEGSFFGDARKALPAVGLELMVTISLLLARTLATRWRRWPAYLLTTPVVLACTFAWLESMVGLLPSTL